MSSLAGHCFHVMEIWELLLSCHSGSKAETQNSPVPSLSTPASLQGQNLGLHIKYLHSQ